MARTNLFLDIETFAGEQKPELKVYEADKRLKDPVKIEADIEGKRQKALAEQDAEWRKQSFDPFVGRIICIGYATDESDLLCVEDKDEETLLKAFEDAIQAFSYPTIIGHNLLEFDAYFLYIKALKYKMPILTSYFSNKHGVSLVDTMILMYGPAWKKMVKLEKMAQLFGLPGKGGMDGSQVHDAYVAGKIKEIVEYCKNDVDVLRKCYWHMFSCGVTG